MSEPTEETVSPEALEQAVDEALAENLDEVVTGEVNVAIVEYADDPSTPGKRKKTVRHVVLDTYVPMKVFNRMVANRDRMIRLGKLRDRAASEGNESGISDEDPKMTFLCKSVLDVWQLSEPDMTMDRLENGLDFAKI